MRQFETMTESTTQDTRDTRETKVHPSLRRMHEMLEELMAEHGVTEIAQMQDYFSGTLRDEYGEVDTSAITYLYDFTVELGLALRTYDDVCSRQHVSSQRHRDPTEGINESYIDRKILDLLSVAIDSDIVRQALDPRSFAVLIQTLKFFGTTTEAPCLTAAVAEHRDPFVREESIQALRMIGGEESVDALISLLQSESGKEVRSDIVKALIGLADDGLDWFFTLDQPVMAKIIAALRKFTAEYQLNALPMGTPEEVDCRWADLYARNAVGRLEAQSDNLVVYLSQQALVDERRRAARTKLKQFQK